MPANITTMIGPERTSSKPLWRSGELALGLFLLFLAAVTWLHPESVALSSRVYLTTVGLLTLCAPAALDRVRSPKLAVIREFLPVPLVLFVFLHLGMVIPLVHPATYDDQLAALDSWLLGAETQQALYNLPLPWWLTDLLTVAYSTFFLMPIALLIVLVKAKDLYLPRVASTIIFTFLLSYVGYFLVPAYGPRAGVAKSRYQTLPKGLVGGQIREVLDHWEKTKTDAFPSGHTAVTLAVLICARRRAPRLYYALLPVGTLLIAATILLTYHYLVDVLAAIPFLLASWLLANWWSGPLPRRAAQGP
ncbi:MAG: phosphatase PAP2 family protein [Thermoanaerobaculaceae bacterium]